MFKLHNLTTGRVWDYDSEPQLKTVTTLYGRQHPKDSIGVTINGRFFKVR